MLKTPLERLETLLSVKNKKAPKFTEKRDGDFKKSFPFGKSDLDGFKFIKYFFSEKYLDIKLDSKNHFKFAIFDGLASRKISYNEIKTKKKFFGIWPHTVKSIKSDIVEIEKLLNKENQRYNFTGDQYLVRKTLSVLIDETTGCTQILSKAAYKSVLRLVKAKKNQFRQEKLKKKINKINNS